MLPESMCVCPVLRVSCSSNTLSFAFQLVLADCICLKRQVCPQWKSEALPDGISLVEEAVLVLDVCLGKGVVLPVPLLCDIQQDAA